MLAKIIPGLRREAQPGLAKASLTESCVNLEFYLYFNAAGEVELHQLVHRLLGRADQLDEALVDAHLELLAGLLVHVNGPVHGVLADPRRQQHGARYQGAGPLGRFDDLGSRLVYQPVVVGVQADADPLLGAGFHFVFIFSHMFTL